MKHLSNLWLFLLCAFSLELHAHDFEVKNADGVTIYYNKLSDNTCEVSYEGDDYDYYRSKYSGHVAIPSSVIFNGTTYSVISIGVCAFEDCYISSVEIPNSVTSIGYYAFYRCTNLSSVEIPSSVTSIGDYAFYGCSRLEIVFNHSSLNITKGSTAYGYVAYYAKFVAATYDDEGFYYSDTDKTHLNGYLGTAQKITIPNSVTHIEDEAFSGCTSIELVEIPSSVTSIGGSAFYDCTRLSSVAIPNTVTRIESYAFSGCSQLKSLTIGTGVISVGKYAFKDCGNLYKVTLLPNSVPTGLDSALPSKPSGGRTTYVANANYSGSNYGTIKKYDYLSSFFEVDGVRYVPVSPSERTCAAIDCTYSSDVKEIVIGKTVKYKGVEMKVVEINPMLLYGNNNIESVAVSTEADIQKMFAYECKNIKKVELDNKGCIGASAFYGCSGIETLTIGQCVIGISSEAFKNCQGLQTVYLAETIKSIGSSAFAGCTNLQKINIPATVSTIEYNTFSGCSSLTEISLPEALTTIGNDAFGDTGLKSIVIPASTTSIGCRTFSGCKSLARFEAKDGKDGLKLGHDDHHSKGLFYDCPLKEVVIGRNLSYYYSPFSSNTSLERVVLTDTPTEVLANEFYGCTSLKDVNIGDGVTTIGDYAFSGCSALESFAFGASVKEIGAEAFSDCTALTKLYAEPSTPPTCGTQALDDINKWECMLYVKNKSKSAYMAADQWKEFFFIEEYYGFVNGIAAPEPDVIDNSDARVYNLNGQRVSAPVKGRVYIVNGKKVVAQ